jgi:Secretion system C-terminal sorting domain
MRTLPADPRIVAPSITSPFPDMKLPMIARLILAILVVFPSAFHTSAAQTPLRDTLALSPGLAWGVEAGTWETGVPTAGPGACIIEATCFATVLGDNYAEPVESRLIRYVAFNVPVATRNPRLEFWHWYDFGAGDSGEVQVRTQEGDWETISPVYTFTGGGVWTRPSLNLVPYAGQDIQLAFLIRTFDDAGTPGSDVRPGWYVDGVQVVSGLQYFNAFEGFESGIQDWSVTAGTWQLGTPSVGPATCNSGSACAGTVLGGLYHQPVDSRLVTAPALVLGQASIRFNHWFSFSTGDSGSLQYRLLDSAGAPAGDWITLAGPYINTSSNVWSSPPPVFLPVPEGAIVQIGFHFIAAETGATAGSDVAAGWYIDDISFNGIGDAILPVTLTGFDALADGDDVVLTWRTASERNNAGFYIQQRSGSSFKDLAFVPGAGTSDRPRTYTYRVPNPGPGTLQYRLKQVDFDGAFAHSAAIEASVRLREAYTLEPAYPNPFNPESTIRFAVRQAEPVTVELYNAVGQRVRTLYSATPAAEAMEEVRIDGAGLPSGIYFVHLRGEGFLGTRMVTLLK